METTSNLNQFDNILTRYNALLVFSQTILHEFYCHTFFYQISMVTDLPTGGLLFTTFLYAKYIHEAKSHTKYYLSSISSKKLMNQNVVLKA